MWQEKANYTITFMCTVLGIKRAGYYAWRERRQTLSPRARRRARLAVRIKELFEASEETSGARRIQADLEAEGERASLWLIGKLMAEQDLVAVQPRSKKRTTIPADDAEDRPDLIGRRFAPDLWAPGQACVGDITYLKTGEGWLYLATVIDLATRRVIGWQMADHMRTSLVADALQMAHESGHLQPGAIFGSDRGSQYTSAEYAALAARLDVRLSVGRTGSCHDNAVAESWFAMLKNEMYYRHRFATRAAARLRVMTYIEVFYNRQRRHSTLGYQTPAEAFATHQTQAAIVA